MSRALDNIEDIYLLSPLQEVMLFQTLYAPESGAYLEQISFPLTGPINVRAFRQAWESLTSRYSTLRTSFFWEDLERPVQVVYRQVCLPWEEHDLRTLPPAARGKRIQEYLEADRRRGFDLSRPPLLRFAWFHTGLHQAHCVWSFHHAILDGWSVHHLIKKLSAFYEAVCWGLEPPADHVRPYGDFIQWLRSQDTDEALAFWRRLLAGVTVPTRFNIDREPRVFFTPGDTFAEDHVLVPPLTTLRLKELGRQHHLTLNTVVQGAWALLLSRYSGEADVLFGAVVSGRPADLEGVESMVGLFINTLPVRIGVDPDARIAEWLNGIQARQLEARRFEHSHLVQIQEASGIPRGLQLFESVLIFENFPMATSLEEQKNQQSGQELLERTNMPLAIMVIPASEILIKILYNRRRFSADAIKRLLGHLRTTLDTIASDSDRSLGDVEILTVNERRQLLEDWNRTGHPVPRRDSVVDLFQSQCARTPDAVAFVCEESRMPYAELNARANRLGHYLQALGVGPEVLVGICVPRSFDLAVALLATFKAGGVYLPLDPSYPEERLKLILEDAGAAVLLTLDSLASALPAAAPALFRLDTDGHLLDRYPETDLTTRLAPSQLAYVIYTSGSTGRPKGVAVEHLQVLNRLHWMWTVHPFRAGEVGCQKTAANFVDSLWELLGPLLAGVPTVIVRDAALRDASRLVEELARHQVTRLWVVPSLLQALLDLYPDLCDRLPRLDFWVTSGEELTPELFAHFRTRMPRATLYNLYGTSEVWDATWFDPARERVVDDRAPIGRPIFNVQAYILDQRMQPVPEGVPGDLYVGGAGLARAYLGRPGLTAEKFVPNPFSRQPGARLYRTGDSARFLAGGVIEYLGRLDGQLKIRGYRVELGEIEAGLLRHAAVKQAVVVAQDGARGDKRLVAYVVPRSAPGPDPAELRRFLKASLPEHMVPAIFASVETLPLTPNGKVDRRALPQPDGEDPGTTRRLVAPRSESERVLAGIWSEILGRRLEQIGVEDHFFTDLGGHSLLATQLVSRVRNALRVELPLRRFFETPIIDALAREIDALKGEQAPGVPAIQRLDRDRFRVALPD